MTLTEGTELAPALVIGAFAEKTLVAAGQRASSNVGCTSSSTSPHSEVMCTSTAGIGQRLAELRARSPAQFPRGWERIWERNAA
jgi:S-(hydroxymethyl)mycothiol dehydrogenase